MRCWSAVLRTLGLFFFSPETLVRSLLIFIVYIYSRFGIMRLMFLHYTWTLLRYYVCTLSVVYSALLSVPGPRHCFLGAPLLSLLGSISLLEVHLTLVVFRCIPDSNLN